jgi:hypothetical protein
MLRRRSFSCNLDTRPSKLFDSDEGLGDVSVFRNEEGSKMQRKLLGAENVRRDLGQVCIGKSA